MSYKIHRASGSGAISETIAPVKPWELEGLRLHLDAGGADSNLTVTIDSGVNSKHNTVLLTLGMNGETDQDYRWSPTQKFTHKNDKVIIEYTNGGSATWGLEIIYKTLGG